MSAWGWESLGFAGTLAAAAAFWWRYRAAVNRIEAVVFGVLIVLIVAVVPTHALPDSAREGLARGVGVALVVLVGAGIVGVHRRSRVARRGGRANEGAPPATPDPPGG